MKIKTTTTFIFAFCVPLLYAQHNNELYNDGALFHVEAGAEVHVWGDVHMREATGDLENYGLIKVQGNSYSDNLFQQSGTGTYRVENSDVNIGERQFIQGSYAVRGGQAMTGVNDGSFYNLELANDQGIVYLTGAGNIADVRNSVDFFAGALQNRIITHDVGMLGALVYPANGSGYSAVFGLMNPATGLGDLISNTVSMNGNMSGIDNGYVQGKFRRAIDPTGGIFNYVLGVEPAGAFAQRGMQYALLDFNVNNYDVVTGYWESASPNAAPVALECSGNTIDYFGGTDSGEWIFEDITGVGTGIYRVQVWPQDDNLIAASIWLITKDDQFLGTPDDCGPTPYGLDRTGFSGFSEFGVAAPTSMLPIELLNINAEGIVDHIDVTWNVANEINFSHYELERSEDGLSFDYLADIAGTGGPNNPQTYVYHDYDVRYFQDFYYRVKNVDLDGSFDYSPVVVANLINENGGFDENSVDLFPNPSFGNFMISIYSGDALQLDMEIHNTLGQLVSARTFTAQAGNTILNVNSESWAPAVYHITLRDQQTGKTINKRFIKE